MCAGQPALAAAGVRPSWTASYELGAVVRALERAAGVPRSVQVHCSGVDLTEARPTQIFDTGWHCCLLRLGAGTSRMRHGVLTDSNDEGCELSVA